MSVSRKNVTITLNDDQYELAARIAARSGYPTPNALAKALLLAELRQSEKGEKI